MPAPALLERIIFKIRRLIYDETFDSLGLSLKTNGCEISRGLLTDGSGGHLTCDRPEKDAFVDFVPMTDRNRRLAFKRRSIK